MTLHVKRLILPVQCPWMNSLNVKWQKQEFTDEQSLQLRQCADELKYLNKQDLSRYQALLT